MERDYVRLDYWMSDRSLTVDFVFWDLGDRGSVSYTHLDVYKRQAMELSGWLRGLSCRGKI